MCTRIYASWRVSTLKFPFLCVRLVHGYASGRVCTCLYHCMRGLHMWVHLWMCGHVSVKALFDVYVLCTSVYASGRYARTCTGPFPCVHHVHACLRVRANDNVKVPVFVCTPCARVCTCVNCCAGGFLLCTLCARVCNASGRMCTCLYHCVRGLHVCVSV